MVVSIRPRREDRRSVRVRERVRDGLRLIIGCDAGAAGRDDESTAGRIAVWVGASRFRAHSRHLLVSTNVLAAHFTRHASIRNGTEKTRWGSEEQKTPELSRKPYKHTATALSVCVRVFPLCRPECRFPLNPHLHRATSSLQSVILLAWLLVTRHPCGKEINISWFVPPTKFPCWVFLLRGLLLSCFKQSP